MNNEFGYLVGMTADDAELAMKVLGIRLRYVSIDGQPRLGTADYRLDRLNVAAEHDDGGVLIITAVRGLG